MRSKFTTPFAGVPAPAIQERHQQQATATHHGEHLLHAEQELVKGRILPEVDLAIAVHVEYPHQLPREGWRDEKLVFQRGMGVWCCTPECARVK
jgi:hypothetical protein